MILYLLRHADANTQAATDDERSLSEKGIRQTNRVGAFCAKNGVLPGVVLTSPLLRARETAEGFASACGINRVLTVEFLRPGMQPEQAIAELNGYREFESVMLVGHEPDFGHLIAALTGMTGGGEIHVRKASLTGIELPAPENDLGRLLFSIPAKYMSR